ncbi:MAG: AtpZ/AtpI family protein [Desulfovibrionaceae bacterium]
MADENKRRRDTEGVGRDLAGKVGPKAERKRKARADKGRGLWFGLGMFGLVGWSVAIPSLLFLALGVWLDGKTDDPYSWTLMMLVLGVAVGCLNAWYWIKRQSRDD